MTYFHSPFILLSFCSLLLLLLLLSSLLTSALLLGDVALLSKSDLRPPFSPLENRDRCEVNYFIYSLILILLNYLFLFILIYSYSYLFLFFNCFQILMEMKEFKMGVDVNVDTFYGSVALYHFNVDKLSYVFSPSFSFLPSFLILTPSPKVEQRKNVRIFSFLFNRLQPISECSLLLVSLFLSLLTFFFFFSFFFYQATFCFDHPSPELFLVFRFEKVLSPPSPSFPSISLILLSFFLSFLLSSFPSFLKNPFIHSFFLEFVGRVGTCH